MTRPRGVILDIDGTLLDSNDAHAQSWVQTFGEFGYTVTFEAVRPLIGMGGDKLLPKLTGVEADSELGEQMSARRRKHFLELYLPKLQPFPAVRELLQTLSGRGLSLVVATSAGGEEVKPLLRQAGIADLIDEKTSSSDAEESKPAPDIVEAAIERSGHEPSELIMLGDTPYDVEAAERAGIDIIALRCGGWPDSKLTGARAIYDDPADLLAHLAESPIG
jgi:HAD superfamily hydrolase (TIGR01509 family)